MKRSSLLLGSAMAAFALLSLLASTLAAGQAAPYPTRPIRLVTPFPPGGATDVLSRMISEKASDTLGQPVIVDNKPGASAIIGTDIVARSAPDGYTIANVISSHAIQRYLYKSVPYDYLADFEPVTLYARSALAFVVNPNVPVHNVPELIAYMKESKTPVPYGTSGVGTAVHLTMEAFGQAAGVKLEHVPYKGGGPAVQDVLGGHIPGVMLGLSTVAPYIKAGQLRAIFVSSAVRQSEFPNVPTLQESGFPGLVNDEWWVLLAPAGTPKPILDTLNAAVIKAFSGPDMTERLRKLGVEFIGGSPTDVRAFMRAEADKGARTLKAANIQPE